MNKPSSADLLRALELASDDLSFVLEDPEIELPGQMRAGLLSRVSSMNATIAAAHEAMAGDTQADAEYMATVSGELSSMGIDPKQVTADGLQLVRGLLGDCLYEFEQEIKNDPEYSQGRALAERIRAALGDEVEL